VNFIPKEHLFIQGASGFGGITFEPNSFRIEISTHGIIFGGFTNGKLNDGLVC
jgi:hypothetical protein